MYSQVGSRGLPWTSVKSPSTRRSGRAASHVLRRVGDPVAGPLDGGPGIGVEQLDPVATDGHLVVVAGDADRPDASEALDDRVRLRAVADDVAEDADAVDRPDGGEDRIEGDEIGVDVREDRQAHRGSA